MSRSAWPARARWQEHCFDRWQLLQLYQSDDQRTVYLDTDIRHAELINRAGVLPGDPSPAA